MAHGPYLNHSVWVCSHSFYYLLFGAKSCMTRADGSREVKTVNMKAESSHCDLT